MIASTCDKFFLFVERISSCDYAQYSLYTINTGHASITYAFIAGNYNLSCR